jgi:hypothetical protein
MDPDPRPIVQETLDVIIPGCTGVKQTIMSYVETDTEWLQAMDEHLTSKGLVFNRVDRDIKVTFDGETKDLVPLFRDFGPDIEFKGRQCGSNPRAKVDVASAQSWLVCCPPGLYSLTYPIAFRKEPVDYVGWYELETSDGYIMPHNIKLWALTYPDDNVLHVRMRLNIFHPESTPLNLVSTSPLPRALRPQESQWTTLTSGLKCCVQLDGLICFAK